MTENGADTPSPRRPGLRGVLRDLFGETDTTPVAALQAEAAAEMQQSAGRSRELLSDAVPGARTPEEAAAALADWQRDPATSLPPNRVFFPADMAETEIYYRVRSRLTKRPQTAQHEREWSLRTRLRGPVARNGHRTDA